MTFRESIPLGETDLTQSEVHALIQTMGMDYKGNKYHQLQRNCNNFASDLAKHLTGQEAPYWVSRPCEEAVGASRACTCNLCMWLSHRQALHGQRDHSMPAVPG